jgi:hypothetical protein
MSFFRHREIFRSDVIRSVRERQQRRPRPHRLDEFPVGYSSAGCTSALPASASPTDPHSALQSSCRSSLFHRTVNSVLTACLTSGGHPKPKQRSRLAFLTMYSKHCQPHPSPAKKSSSLRNVSINTYGSKVRPAVPAQRSYHNCQPVLPFAATGVPLWKPFQAATSYI